MFWMGGSAAYLDRMTGVESAYETEFVLGGASVPA